MARDRSSLRELKDESTEFMENLDARNSVTRRPLADTSATNVHVIYERKLDVRRRNTGRWTKVHKLVLKHRDWVV